MKRALYQLVHDADNGTLGLVPLNGGVAEDIPAVAERIGGPWVGIPSDDGSDLRVAQVIVEIREHKVRR